MITALGLRVHYHPFNLTTVIQVGALMEQALPRVQRKPAV